MHPQSIPLSNLLLDPNNYRLQESDRFEMVDEDRFALDSTQANAQSKLEALALGDLVRSIKSNGFLEIERIVVTPLKDNSEGYLVIEGNRRLAALKRLKREYDAGLPIPEGLVATFHGVPCVVVESGDNAFFKEALMGIRHVSGIKKWDGFQQSKLVADLRDKYELDSAEIADRLGMKPNDVNRRYRAYKALQQMQYNEDFGAHATPAMYPLFHEAVALPSVRQWLGWNSQSNKFDNLDELEKFYDLISPKEGDDEKEIPPKLTGYADVRSLGPLVSNEEALSILVDPNRDFEDAKAVAKRDELTRRWKSEVSDAITALKKIGIFEVSNFKSNDVSVLTDLVGVANDILEKHKKLAS